MVNTPFMGLKKKPKDLTFSAFGLRGWGAIYDPGCKRREGWTLLATRRHWELW